MKQDISVSKLKIVFSLTLLIVWTLTLVFIFLVAKAIRSPRTNNLIPIYHKGVLKCFNLECVVEGIPLTMQPTLYISNHISYLDIFVLGSVLPGAFIAKSEIAKLPLFGLMTKFQNTLFIERGSLKADNQIQRIQRRLRDKSNLILFPEGTTSTGTYVAPFHSSIFQSAKCEDPVITIQPVTIAYTHYKDELMDREARDYYAWYGPRKILPHLLNGLGLGHAQVKLTCHQPIKFDAFESRKEASRYCETVIRQCLLDTLELEHEVTP